MSSPSNDARGAVMQLLSGYWYTQALRAIAALGLADALREGPLTAGELAARCRADPRALGRFMRAVATVGLFSFAGQGRYGLTPMSQWLRTDVDGSLAAAARFGGEPDHWLAWGGLVEALRTGRTAFDAVHGRSLFDHLGERPGDVALFQAVMAGGSEWNEALVGACALGDARLLVDVGGGHGGLALAAIREHEALRAIVFDRPEVVQEAGAGGQPERCRFVGGDFFEAVPPGGDRYVLRFILHDWDDGRALQILRSCRAAMGPEARLLVIERLLAEEGPCAAAMLDVSMLVLTGGRERTRGDHGALLSAAGLRLLAVRQTVTGLAVLEAAPVGSGAGGGCEEGACSGADSGVATAQRRGGIPGDGT